MDIGDILKMRDDSDQRPMRVIGLDLLEVFYDSWWEHLDNWGLSKGTTASFYRMPRDWCERNTKKVGEEKLSEKEYSKLRPDLPHRICIVPSWKWSRTVYKSEQEFSEALGDLAPKLDEGVEIRAGKLAIYPSGPKGGIKPPKYIEARNGASFSQLELLFKSHNIQAQYETNHINGVGIYRDGLKGNNPSYYLGEKYDAAGHNRP